MVELGEGPRNTLRPGSHLRELDAGFPTSNSHDRQVCPARNASVPVHTGPGWPQSAFQKGPVCVGSGSGADSGKNSVLIRT